jgi:putative component of membrane protein insertase Oxa1/YidC/SpoIIIJ protein YidD
MLALICRHGTIKSYKIAVLERHELLSTHILVGVLVVCCNAFAIDGAL